MALKANLDLIKKLLAPSDLLVTACGLTFALFDRRNEGGLGRKHPLTQWRIANL